MKSNPFSCSTYENIWLSHYGNNQKAHKFKFLDGVKFIKGKYPSHYVNIGGNYTSGLFYEINKNETDYKGKSFIVYDVPDFLDNDEVIKSKFKIIKLNLYKGFYVNVKQYKDISEVVAKCYSSSKSRYNFRRSLKQLNERHDITTKMFFGNIKQNEYDNLMEDFIRILKMRFDDLGIYNTLLPMWDFYKDVLFPLINEKKVALFVVYDNDQPIALSINFAYDDSLLVATRTFDVNYSRLGIGNIEIYYLIDWCISNNIKVLDFSKGERDYKKRWCDIEYNYQRHIMYDSNSLKATATVKLITGIHSFKQFLRDKKINILARKVVNVFKR